MRKKKKKNLRRESLSLMFQLQNNLTDMGKSFNLISVKQIFIC
jgi:hypothetical protein